MNDTVKNPDDLDFTRPLRTVHAKLPVHIISTEHRDADYPVIGYVGDSDEILYWQRNGRYLKNGEHPSDLEYVPQFVDAYINVMQCGDTSTYLRIYTTLYYAKDAAKKSGDKLVARHYARIEVGTIVDDEDCQSHIADEK